MTLQTITLHLDGITAGDYLAWVRDPDTPGLDAGLRTVSIVADPLGSTIDATLAWRRRPPGPLAAAAAAGLPLTENVRTVTSRLVPADTSRTRIRRALRRSDEAVRQERLAA